MLQTAEQVAKRYNIAARAHGRVRRGQPAEGLRGAGGRQVQRRDRADHRDGRRGRRGDGPAHQGSDGQQPTRASAPGTTYEGISGIKPALPGGVIAAGNASQFSDGAGACVVVSEELRAAAAT